MNKLSGSEFGRVVIHILAVFYRVNHFQKPHLDFAYAGIVRYVKGRG